MPRSAQAKGPRACAPGRGSMSRFRQPRHHTADVPIGRTRAASAWGPQSAETSATWDAHKIGLCAPPLETPRGWLLLYHGVHTTAAGSIYRFGLALLDIAHPDRVLARSSEWLFGPDAPDERIGNVDQVVFSCGWQLLDDGDTIRLYYGAADTSICVATAILCALLDWLSRHST